MKGIRYANRNRHLKKIEEQPMLYLGSKNLSRLHYFIIGYLVCEEENGRKDSLYIFEEFKKYFSKIYGIVSYYSYADVIRSNCETDEEAFDKFFEVFNDFLAQR